MKSAPSFFADPPPPAPTAAAGSAPVEPAVFDEALHRLGRRLPSNVYIGTSSWTYADWKGLVYADAYGQSQLSRWGLAAYSQHPVFRTVGIDRTFYKPLSAADFGRYASQVPPGFRFVVKSPALVTDAVKRTEDGVPQQDNPQFLDVAAAVEQFIVPALAGMGAKAGPLVFQLSPLPRDWVRGAAAAETIERIGAFVAALPREIEGARPLYAVELRNAELLTPRFVRTLREAGARLCLGVHARMPEIMRQSAALRAMDGLPEEGDQWLMKGPLIVRWTLHSGLGYDEAKDRYAPFDRLIDADILTRGTIAHLIQVAIRSGQDAFVVASNKAEGSAPLTCIELAHAVVEGEPGRQ